MTALTLAGTSGTAGGAWEGLLFAGYRGRGGGYNKSCIRCGSVSSCPAITVGPESAACGA